MPNDTNYDIVGVMKEITAVELRQSVKRVVSALAENGEPILLKVGDEPVAVLISLRDFRERFVLEAAADERRRLVEEILADVRQGAAPVDEVFTELRGE